MKTQLIAVLLAAVSAAATAPAFAAENPVTRAQVRAELAALEKAGYLPNRPNDPHYPDNLQAALNRVRDNAAQVADTQTSGYGNDAAGATQSGTRAVTRVTERSIYFGH
ncbi:DUF4148 domain-containing protein [Burkholderia dolosa]|jgi:hypothetical protein|uniref:DUF4148 domain-containing protein n=1 Tax=Burkholderia dolosa TaxID=152500 RepID=UPI001B8E349B|nr:DUF4148 domain-containing protein [Burkholderia dolosa]MBR8061203.1 DUF4148 domain-containing protein [Burkholderia dolosa]